ncbi:MAG: Rne/Rng family ribonuclease [Myxococcales bacterium]|nr:Rne/Rng family ribonuclease [Myxococcales bacterium]
MSKIMLINVTHAEESRVGIVDDGQLESFEIESFSREHLKGNIYKGVVRRIHPAIEAAFVDIGADRDAFLPLDEICFRNLPEGRSGGEIQERGEKGRRRIKEVLKSGDEILVQIVKEQFTNKPPTLSTFYSLPGRYLVLLPGSEDAGISRKIEGEERVRVREMIERLRPPAGCGIIVRTAAGFDDEHGELERDLAYLARLWESIKQNAATKRGPALIYREHDLVLRNIRDYFTPDIDEVFIDNEEVYERAKDFLHNIMPGKEHLLHLYQGDQPIFSRFGLETQIESIYKRRVALKSGGSIVIDGTEALTAIDVNSGGSMRGSSQEETAHKTNLEAAREVARQLRLRDLGGIIVVDFIDMRVPSHIGDVERALREAMRPEKARHDIGRISKLGLLEISRQRLRPAAVASSYTACPMCEGYGSIRTPESAALGTLRKIHHRIAEGDVAQMNVTLPRDVAMYLLNQKRDDLATLERRYSARINIVISDKLMPHQSELEVRIREVTAPVAVLRPGEVASAERAPSGVARSARPGAQRPAAAAVGYGHGPVGTLRAGEDAASPARRRRGGRSRRGEGAAEARPAPEAEVPAAGEAAPIFVADEERPAGALVVEPAAATDLVGDEAVIAADSAAEAVPVIAPIAGEPEVAAALPTAIDRTAAILAAGDSGWIEAVPLFMPVEAAVDASASSEASRRRRRRGGRRGGRGRRPGPGGAGEGGDVPSSPAGEARGTEQRRRRRRGGSGRRRATSEGRTVNEDAESLPTAAATAPAGPPHEP